MTPQGQLAEADADAARMGEAELPGLAENAKAASDFLKALSHESRLMILCHLAEGERSVTELENLLDLRQPTVSQQLARLRLEGLVATRREGKAIYYSLASGKARRLIEVIHDMFCGIDEEEPGQAQDGSAKSRRSASTTS